MAQTPWHLTPPALGILAGIRAKPGVEWKEAHFVRTSDRWALFTGRDFKRLSAIYSDRFAELDARRPWSAEPFRDELYATPEDLIGALFGDPNGSDQFRTHRDDSPEWASIRAEVAKVLPRWSEVRGIAA